MTTFPHHSEESPKFRGLERISAQANFTFAAYNLIRMGNIFNWNPSTA